MDKCRIEIGFDELKEITLKLKKIPVIKTVQNCQIYCDRMNELENAKLLFNEESIKRQWNTNSQSGYLIIKRKNQLDIYVKQAMKIARLRNGHLLLAEEITDLDQPRCILQSQSRHFIACCNCLKEVKS